MPFVRLTFLAFVCFAFLPAWLWAIDPVRPGDQIEVLVLSKWYPGEVLAFENGTALVKYTFAGEMERKFTLDQMRFPNNEGSWMIWRDTSGKFKITARLVGRSETHVKLKKEDGSVIEVPIANLADSLQRQLGKIAKAEKEFVDASLVRVGDQVEWKWFSTWYPAVVKELRVEGALIEYDNGFGPREQEVKYADMRYPNGEGPWADWKDTTGKHKVKARYLTHNQTHVELLLEDGKRVRMERSKLAPDIAAEMAKRPILTRRAKETSFDLTRVDFENVPSWIEYATDVPKYSGSELRGLSATAQPDLPLTDFSCSIGRPNVVVKPAILVRGEKPLIAVVLSPKDAASEDPITLYWIDMETQKAQAGPNFLPGEVILAYSPTQQRLLTAEGYDLRGSATRFSCYRLAPGGKFAEPEVRWQVPKVSFYSTLKDSRAQFVGSDQVLVGYGGTLTLWNLTKRSVAYVVPSSNSEFCLSPDESYILTNQFSRSVVIETQTGEPKTRFDAANALFCNDGQHVYEGSVFQSTLTALGKPETPHIFHASSWQEQPTSIQPSVIDNKWLFTGSKLWDVQKGMLVWSYNTSDINLLLQEPVGESLLVVGSDSSAASGISIRVAITHVPSPTTLKAYTEIKEDRLYVVRAGIKVRIDPSITEPRILEGVKRAIQKSGWTESEDAEITIKASAQRGETQTPTYNISRYGRLGAASEESTLTISVTPWIQSVTLEYAGKSVWGTSSGGVPGFVSTREDGSAEAEIRKCEVPRYDLFESLMWPEKVMYPKWNNGFGTTTIGKTSTTETPVKP